MFPFELTLCVGFVFLLFRFLVFRVLFGFILGLSWFSFLVYCFCLLWCFFILVFLRVLCGWVGFCFCWVGLVVALGLRLLVCWLFVVVCCFGFV